MFFVFAIWAQSCNPTVPRKNIYNQFKTSFQHKKKNDVCNQSALHFKLCAADHPQKERPLWTTLTLDKRKGIARKKRITCANSHLAIFVVFALQRMLELPHLRSLPATIAVFSTVVQEFNWSTVRSHENEGTQKEAAVTSKGLELKLEIFRGTTIEGWRGSASVFWKQKLNNINNNSLFYLHYDINVNCNINNLCTLP